MACLATFVENHSLYVEVSKEDEMKVPVAIVRFIYNHHLLSEAKSMLAQLKTVASAMKAFQVKAQFY